MAPYSDDVRRYYDVLDLEPGASTAEVEQAYREMAKIWHPDRFPDDARLRTRAERKMKEINKAREGILAYRERTAAHTSREDKGAAADKYGVRRAPHEGASTRRRLSPRLLAYSIVFLVFLLAVASRVPIAIGLSLLFIVAAVLFAPGRKD